MFTQIKYDEISSIDLLYENILLCTYENIIIHS